MKLMITQILDQIMTRSENGTHENGLRQIIRVAEVADEERQRIRDNDELTDVGKLAGFKRVRETSYKALEPHERALERRADTLAETKRKALERPPATAESLAMDREIRDRLVAAGADEVSVPARYFSALSRGDDDFVRAVEGAPEAFKLISADTRAKGVESRLEKSPLAPEIEEQEHAYALYNQMVLSTKTELDKLELPHSPVITFL